MNRGPSDDGRFIAKEGDGRWLRKGGVDQVLPPDLPAEVARKWEDYKRSEKEKKSAAEERDA